ncbi:PRELI domain-containing protein 1, mitochondrial-like [Liolophura sinensis]|uniref:PRELI domain-containing protein 1, mitochondrial-like n=1 Tax=Liolophura sinensis TaxID=3198878 RepID=UPI0031584367
MVKLFDSSSVIKYTWDQVSCALWQKYPNPHSKHVLTEDVLSREVREGKLYTKRLLTKTNRMPRWGERIVPGPRNVCIVEETVVDPDNKTFITYTRNIAMRRFLALEEKCVYSMAGESKKWTECDRKAWLCSSLFGFSRPITAFGCERYKNNLKRATKGLEFTLERLFQTDPVAENAACQQVYSKDKFRDTARKATEIAKAKTSPLLQTN